MAVELNDEQKSHLENLDPRTQAAAMKYLESVHSAPGDVQPGIREVVSRLSVGVGIFALVYDLETIRDHLIPNLRLLIDSLEVANQVSFERRGAKTH